MLLRQGVVRYVPEPTRLSTYTRPWRWRRPACARARACARVILAHGEEPSLRVRALPQFGPPARACITDHHLCTRLNMCTRARVRVPYSARLGAIGRLHPRTVGAHACCSTLSENGDREYDLTIIGGGMSRPRTYTYARLALMVLGCCGSAWSNRAV